MALIEAKNLSFEYYKGAAVLQDVSLEIEKGTINVILGLNGCGKTTLIKLLAGLLKPTAGTITIDGKDVGKMTDHERSKLIAYVPQLTTSRSSFTVQEYLILALSNQKRWFWQPGKKDADKVKDFITNLGIPESRLKRRIDELSGGERQIIIICGALMQDAQIIILDEPTAALDMKNQFAVLKFLKKSKKQDTKTIIFSCHDPNHALKLGGQTIALHEGKVFLQGDSRKIVCAENLKKVYGDNVRDSKKYCHNIIILDDIND